jgi:hypothetical protein
MCPIMALHELWLVKRYLYIARISRAALGALASCADADCVAPSNFRIPALQNARQTPGVDDTKVRPLNKARS